MSAESASSTVATELEPNVAEALAAWVARGVGAPGPVSPLEAKAFASLLGVLGNAGDSFYAECRLAGARRQLDLLISFAERSAHLPVLRDVLAERTRNASPAARDAWSEAQTFVERWTNENDPVSSAVSAIWLELDDVLGPIDAAAPSLSACVVPGYGVSWNAGGASRSVLGNALRDARRALAPQCSLDVFERSERVLAELPKQGRFIHLSVMTARPSRALKLYGVCPTHELVPYLERIGFQDRVGPLEELSRGFAGEASLGGEVYFDLNLTDSCNAGAASFGLAFSQQNQRLTAPRDVGRRELLGRLTALGLCTADEAEALSDWVEPSRSARRLVSGDLRAHHWLDLKAVLAAGAWSLKAYLGFTRFRSPFLFDRRGVEA